MDSIQRRNCLYVGAIFSILLSFYLFGSKPADQDALDSSGRYREQQLRKSNLGPSQSDIDHADLSPVLTTETLDFLGLFALRLRFHESIDGTQTRLTESSNIILDFGTKTIPFLNTPLIPTLEIRHRDGLVECDTIPNRGRLSCLDPETFVVLKEKRSFSKRWEAQPKGKLFKKFKFTFVAADHNASINFDIRELRQIYVDRALLATLRRTNMIGELSDYSGGYKSDSKTKYGYNIQGVVNFDQNHRYKCGGNIYSAFNITRPFRPLHGHKFPRYASNIRYMLEKGLLEGMILTSPDFTCKRLDPPDFILISDSTFKIDFVRSQYFPFTFLEIKSNSVPRSYFLDSLIRVEQTKRGINAPSYETRISGVAWIMLFGPTELTYGAVQEQFFNETQGGLNVEQGTLEGFPRNSVMKYRSVNTNDIKQHILVVFISPPNETSAPKVFSWSHNESSASEHVSLTIDVVKNWKKVVNDIINDPMNYINYAFVGLSQSKSRKATDRYWNKLEYPDDEYDEVRSTVPIEVHLLDSIRIKQVRSIVRQTNKLRLLQDTRVWTLKLIVLVGYEIELKKLTMIREEKMRHCGNLPHRAISRAQDFDCLPARKHIKNDSFRSLGIDTSAAIDSYIKYYTLKVHDSLDTGSIDMFPYKPSVLDKRIASVLAANNLTELSFIKDHFRFGAHAEGKFSSKRNQDYDCTFSADIVWAINSSSNVFNDNLVLVDNLTTELLLEYHKGGLYPRTDDPIGRFANIFEGHLFEMTNLKIRFDSNSKTPYHSRATLITRDQFPFIYYNHHLHSHHRVALNYSGTIRQTRHGSLYNTTYSIVSSSSSPLGSFLFNRTTSSNQESQNLADQVLFFYPYFDIWFRAKSSNDTATAGPRYFGKFFEAQNHTIAVTKFAPSDSKADVSLEQHSDDDYWKVKFKVQKDVYKDLSKHMQIVNKTASLEEQHRMKLEDLLAYVTSHTT